MVATSRPVENGRHGHFGSSVIPILLPAARGEKFLMPIRRAATEAVHLTGHLRTVDSNERAIPGGRYSRRTMMSSHSVKSSRIVSNPITSSAVKWRDSSAMLTALDSALTVRTS